MTADEVAENAARVLARCRAAAERASRAPESVTVMAACKTQPLPLAVAPVEAGITHFGENRVQEAAEKWAPQARARVTLAMIGHLQSNKVKAAVRLFDEIHSVDSVRLARLLAGRTEAGRLPVYLEVNIGEEPAKTGFRPEDLPAALDEIAALETLEMAGLMAVPPAVHRPEEGRAYFVRVRRLSERLRGEYAALGSGLSMGMSGDFEVAIEEGATEVRVGQAIYGARPSLY